MEHQESLKINSQIPSKIIELFEENNEPFENLERPGFLSSGKRSRNYKTCIKYYKQLKIKVDEFKMVYSYSFAYIKDLDKFVNERANIEKMYYENMKNAKFVNSTLLPQQAPEDAGHAHFKALEEKRQQIKKIFDSIEGYNNVVRLINDYYEDNYSNFNSGVIGYLKEEDLPVEIDAQLLYE